MLAPPSRNIFQSAWENKYRTRDTKHLLPKYTHHHTTRNTQQTLFIHIIIDILLTVKTQHNKNTIAYIPLCGGNIGIDIMRTFALLSIRSAHGRMLWRGTVLLTVMILLHRPEPTHAWTTTTTTTTTRWLLSSPTTSWTSTTTRPTAAETRTATTGTITTRRHLSSSTLPDAKLPNDTVSPDPTRPETDESSRRQQLVFNQGLNDLAESCSNPKVQVVTKAQACQDRYTEAVQSHTHPTDLISFNTVLKAWTKAGACLAEHAQHGHMLDANVPVYTPRDCAQRAQDLLQARVAQQQDVDTMSYNSVMDGWAKSRAVEAPLRVEELLAQLQQGSRHGLYPDTLSYNALVDAYAYSNKPERMDRLEQIWQDMQRMDQQQTDSDDAASVPRVRPTVRSINSILHAYARQVPEDATYAPKALQILVDMKRQHEKVPDPAVQPDVMTYTTVMDAFARVGNVQAAEQADQLFSELQSLYESTKNDRFRPSVYTYVTLLIAWSRSHAPQATTRASEILEALLADPHVTPNARAFTAVIATWGRSRDVRKAPKAVQILQRMKALATTNPEVAPSLYSYNSAMDCCARVRGDSVQNTAALKMAFAIFQSLNADTAVQANHVTFGILLKNAGALLPAGDERNKIAIAVLKKAMAAGQVDPSVLINFQKAADASVVSVTLEPLAAGQGHLDFNKIPAAWNKHVQK